MVVGGGLFAIKDCSPSGPTHSVRRSNSLREFVEQMVLTHPFRGFTWIEKTHHLDPYKLMVVGGGFEPPKLSRQIYSLIPLAAREPHRVFPRLAQAKNWSWREELNPQPTDYKSVALPIELRQPQPTTRIF